MKVRIVDDHEVNRMLPIAHHKRLGVETVQSADGQAALDRLAEDAFDAVLLDVSMPGPSGLDVRRRVRADPRPAGTKLIALTAHSFQINTEDIMSAGFDDLLVKPIRRDTLLRSLGLATPAPASAG